MVFVAVAIDSKVMPPHFFEDRLKINTEEYLKILILFFLPRNHENNDPNKGILAQESAPAHGAKKVQTYLKENLPVFVP